MSEMPTSVAAVLVLMLALLPGMLGAYFLEHLGGRDWRERDWRAALRYLAISVLGLALYAIIARRLSWPPPRDLAARCAKWARPWLGSGSGESWFDPRRGN